jgi:DNA-binding GntR family transcriptional regulator
MDQAQPTSPQLRAETASADPASERAYQEIRGAMLSGALQQGTRLLENELASTLQMSRTPIREALKRLLAEELVSIEAGGSTVVRTIDLNEVAEIYAIRGALEGLATRLAAERITSSELARLRWLMGFMRDAANDENWLAWADANLRFHDVIYGAADNKRLRLMSRKLKDMVHRFSATSATSPGGADEVLERHERIVLALEARRQDEAEEAARHHIELALERVRTLYQSDAAPGEQGEQTRG